MNDKFFNLPLEKQQRIINAAYKVFSQSSYKKAPMSEIADEGGISKALLFHYFTNKKELYFYLWNSAIEMTRKINTDYAVLGTNDFFEMLKRSLFARCSLMRSYPYVYKFSLNAYYEQHPDIEQVISENYTVVSQLSKNKVFDTMDTSVFRRDVDLKMMYSEIFYAVDGYMMNKYRSGNIVPDEIEKEITALINHWKQIYTESRK